MSGPCSRIFLSCDWGTTSFRLRWIEGGNIIREFQDTTGCRSLFERSRQVGESASRASLYERTLRQALEEDDPNRFKGAPLVISGMVSSSIGWQELPYASIPTSIDGAGLRVEPVQWDKPVWLGDTYLVSGVASDTDMMRGEETEAIGLLAQQKSLPDSMTLLLPGTHSKHLEIRSGTISGIRTYMTGELYEVLARHSILRSSIDMAGEADNIGFDAGVASARDRGGEVALFQTRVRHVLGGRSQGENASFLSGALVASELCDLRSTTDNKTVFLGGSPQLRDRYHRAMQQLGLPVNLFSDEMIRRAVPMAHELILARLTS